VKSKVARHGERIKAIRRETKLVQKFSKKALRIFTKEIARRLEDLNHAHQLATERNNEFVRIDIFQRDINSVRDETRAAIDEVKALTKPAVEYVLSQRSGPRALTWPMVVAVISFFGLVAGLLLTFLAIATAVIGLYLTFHKG